MNAHPPDWPWNFELRWMRGPRRGEVRGWALVDAADFELLQQRAWRFDNGYAKSGETFMHRLLLGLEHGDKRQADHRNRDRLDNRRDNLRVVTHAENAQNLPAVGSSGYRGVSLHPSGRWSAQVMLGGVAHKLPSFRSAWVAAVAVEQRRLQLMPASVPVTGLDPAGVRCDDCGASETPMGARFWTGTAADLKCFACGPPLPKRGPKFKGPRACSNCNAMTTRMKRGRCDSCYSHLRRTGRDR